MSEAEILRRLDRMECRLPPPLCDKVGHVLHAMYGEDFKAWYACKHCGKDETEIDREPMKYPGAKAPPEVDKETTVTKKDLAGRIAALESRLAKRDSREVAISNGPVPKVMGPAVMVKDDAVFTLTKICRMARYYAEEHFPTVGLDADVSAFIATILKGEQ